MECITGPLTRIISREGGMLGVYDQFKGEDRKVFEQVGQYTSAGGTRSQGHVSVTPGGVPVTLACIQCITLSVPMRGPVFAAIHS